ncbi:MAG: hypothetical protein ACI92G_002522 [Candidatus Pelagisphaera sp.]|jgi:hypothetical protein
MIATFLLNTIVVALSVVIHYEVLYRMFRIMPKVNIKHRMRIVLGVFGALIAHAAEVWVFAIAYFFMHHRDGWGELQGNFTGSLMDCVYFSFSTFSTVGFGDIEPVGNIRYLTGIESLTGLVLITWTASFLYLEMRRFWDDR